MSAIPNRIKNLSELEGLEIFDKYGVDCDGNVWSFNHNKVKKLSPGWNKKKGSYQHVILSANGVKKKMLIHRLVAMAFIPTNDYSLEVNHINRNQCDNRVENLEWSNRENNLKHNQLVKGFKLDDFVSNKIKEVHAASIRKGLPVPDSYSFINSLLEGALEDYMNQYGLKRYMNPLPNC